MIKNIIFDLGGVLIDWSPRYHYRKIFKTEEEVDWFLNNICTLDWNEKQDAGRTTIDATASLVKQFPDHEKHIRMYYDHWEDMLAGPIYESIQILQNIHFENKHHLFALTNWSAELFPIAFKRYEFLHIFRDILVSGIEKLKKPDAEIYQCLLDRNQLLAKDCLFIDDNLRNIQAADKMGFEVIHFIKSSQLRDELNNRFGINC